MNFEQLKSQSKTVIYKESETELTNTDWELWGERKTENEHVYVYRKIVSIEDAEQYYLENVILK